MTTPAPPRLDPIFHQQVRTRLTLLLYTRARSFTHLKTELKLTDGNLDAHLRKLSAAGFLHSEMVIENRPHTLYQLSESGARAFETYLAALQSILNAVQK